MKDNSISKWNSILLGLYINIKLINQAVVSYIPSLQSSSLRIMYIMLIGLVVWMYVKKRYLNVDVGYLFLPAVLIIFYLVTYLLYSDKMSVSGLFFVMFVIFPFFIMGEIEYKIVIETIMITSLLALPPANSIFTYVHYSTSISMGTTYSLLPTVVASLVHFIKIRENKRILMWLVYAGNFYLLFRMLINGVRGPVACVLVAIVIMLVTKYDQKYKRIQIKPGQSLIVGSVVIIFALFWEKILLILQNVLIRRGISLYFIDKFLSLSQENNLTNGREPIFQKAIEGFWNNPVCGNGVSMFAYNTGMIYPHNFILQLLYDGGLILFLIVMAVMVFKFYRKVQECNSENEYVFLTILFAVSIPAALFSGDVWENYRFWTFIAFLTYNSRSLQVYEYNAEIQR